MSNTAAPCPRCGKAEISEDGLCPKCLLEELFPEIARPSIPVTAPLQLGNYNLVEEIGRGAHGIVFRALHQTLGYSVAVKLLAGAPFVESEGRARFEREAMAAAKLRHPNLVRVLEAGESGGQAWLAMDYIEGENLAERLRKDLPPVEKSVEWLAKVAEAAHHAHCSGIIHRDIKPANILLNRLDEPFLSDFGVAGVLDGSELTASFHAIGSFHYMAPEQLSCAREISPLADVYALGAVLYHCLTGHPPYSGAALPDLIRAISEEEPVLPSRLNASVPRDLETICLKCLNKEPEHRYSSAEALALDLRNFLRGEPVTARPVTPVQRFARWTRRRPKSAALVLGSLLSIIFGAGIALWHWNTAVNLAHSEQKARSAAEAATAVYKKSMTQALFEQINSDAVAHRIPQALARLAWMMRRDPTNRIAFEWAIDQLQNLMPLPLSPEIEFGNPVRQILASPDSRLACIVGSRGLLEIWDISAKPAKKAAAALDRQVLASSWAEDSRQMFLVTQDGLWKWDLSEAAKKDSAPVRWAKLEKAHAAVISGDHFGVATANGAVAVWTIDSETPIFARTNSAPADLIALSPDNQFLGMRVTDRELSVVNLRTGATARRVATSAPVSSMAFSRDHRWFAFGQEDGAIYSLELATGKQVSTGVYSRRKAHSGSVVYLHFDRAFNYLLSASVDGTARWMKVNETGLGSAKFQVEPRHPQVEMSDDGYYSLTVAPGGKARLYRSKAGAEALLPLRQKAPVTTAALSGNRRRAITAASDNRFRIWDIPPATAHFTTIDRSGHILGAALADDAGPIATLNNFGELTLWDVPAKHDFDHPVLAPARILDTDLENMTANTSGQVVAGWNKTRLKVWNISGTPTELLTIGLFQPLRRVILNEAGNRLLLLFNSKMHIWNLDSRILVDVPLDTQPSAMAISPSGKQVALGEKTGKVCIVNGDVGSELNEISTGISAVSSLEFDSSGKFIAVGTENGAAQVYSATGLAAASPLMDHQFTILSAKFSSDGQQLISAGQDGTVRIWDWRQGRLLRLFSHREASLKTSLSFSTYLDSSLQRFFIFADDGYLRMWDLKSGYRFRPDLRHRMNEFNPVISSGGKLLLIAEGEFRLLLRPLSPPESDAPPWFPEFVENVIGFSVGEDGSYAWNPPLSAFELREKFPLESFKNEPWMPLILR